MNTCLASPLFTRRLHDSNPCKDLLVDYSLCPPLCHFSHVHALFTSSIHPTLQVLASLQVLGRGSSFDDICQLSQMSEAVVCRSFHIFCKMFAQEFYAEYVRLPTGEDLEKVMHVYHLLGFTGAIGSTDVTHVRWGCCPHTLARSYTGKEGSPTIA